MDRWVDKTAVVTGASSGIGAVIAVALADAGIRVIGLARRIERINALKSNVVGGGSISARKCDISNNEEIAAAYDWIENTFGAVHIMINNAGVLHSGGITEVSNDMVSEQELLSTLDTNVKGTILCTRHAINSMNRHAVDGHVINVNSIAGHYIPMVPYFNIYTSTKHAVTAFTKGLMIELAHNKNKIKLTSLSPGLVLTELGGVSEAALSIPALHPEDIANAVLYVLSTAPHVNIEELTITSVAEQRL